MKTDTPTYIELDILNDMGHLVLTKHNRSTISSDDYYYTQMPKDLFKQLMNDI